MAELHFHLHLEGKVSPEDEMGESMSISSSAVLTDALPATLGKPGEAVTHNAIIETDNYGGFRETGSLTFPTGTLTYETRGEGFIEETIDPETQQGCVTRRLTGGSGALSGATGYLVSTFTVNENATICDSLSGVVFLAG